MNHPTHVDIEFSRPVMIAGVETKTVRMREPKVLDQKIAQKQARGDDVEGETFLFASLCELDPQTINGLPMRDYVKLKEAYAVFLS
ncbi:phage tail assembly protein [Aquabacterium sp.]|uniref:phage tail assembly protein n=1 Tax=Aquabacterium sp. TaxID=1872578 RepID=UPI003BB19525